MAALEAQLRQAEGATPAGSVDLGDSSKMLAKKPRGAKLPPDARENPHFEQSYPQPQVRRGSGPWSARLVLRHRLAAHLASFIAPSSLLPPAPSCPLLPPLSFLPLPSSFRTCHSAGVPLGSLED